MWKDETNQSQKKEKEKRGVNKRGGQRGVTAVRSNITSHFNVEETLRLSEGKLICSVCGIKGFAACSAALIKLSVIFDFYICLLK